ncbi:hypothetical protein THII_0203 [Thioploca ingrica]|uniref:Uncharacterized protein n=1 Tax=Thioploca ingrica TaxID=40754 RepID=A0A090AI80_9GAMM|nr:hypothetical protein THII_0203 [Thioploca ingrica]
MPLLFIDYLTIFYFKVLRLNSLAGIYNILIPGFPKDLPYHNTALITVAIPLATMTIIKFLVPASEQTEIITELNVSIQVV